MIMNKKTEATAFLTLLKQTSPDQFFSKLLGFKRSLEGFVAAQLEQFYSRRAVNLRNEILVANKKISLRLKSNERIMRKEVIKEKV